MFIEYIQWSLKGQGGESKWNPKFSNILAAKPPPTFAVTAYMNYDRFWAIQ